MQLMTPAVGALNAVPPPKRITKTPSDTHTLWKTAAAMSVDILILAINVVTVRLIRWIPTNDTGTTGYWVAHPNVAVSVGAGASAWIPFTVNDTPADYAIWLVSGAVVDITEARFDIGNKFFG